MSVLNGKEIYKFRYGKSELNPHNYLLTDNFNNRPSKASIFRRNNPEDDPLTEISNEIGTTDRLVGELFIEEMLTTPGKLPNEMYDLENTPPEPATTVESKDLETIAPTVTEQILSTSERIVDINEPYVAEPPEPCLLLIVGVIIGILFLFGCIIACAISRVKKKNYKKINKKDIECNSAGRPLLSTCKRKDSSSSTCCRN